MISVIIPTYKVKLNDLVDQVTNLSKQGEFELIFSDGESDSFVSLLSDITSILDNTNIQLKVVQNPVTYTVLSRAQSMNLAAIEAKGDILLFLHIDTLLPPNALKTVIEKMKDKHVIAGGFLKRYDKPFAFRITEWILNLRASFSKRLVGTNAIFIKRSVFDEHHFPEHFMEDVAFSDLLLKEYSKKDIVIISDYITVSSDKYIKNSILKRILINGLVLFLYRHNNVGYEDLEKLYRSSKDQSLLQICKRGYQLIISG